MSRVIRDKLIELLTNFSNALFSKRRFGLKDRRKLHTFIKNDGLVKLQADEVVAKSIPKNIERREIFRTHP